MYKYNWQINSSIDSLVNEGADVTWKPEKNKLNTFGRKVTGKDSEE